MTTLVRLFKLEATKLGSEIHFKEFEILLFKLSKILFQYDNNTSIQQKYMFLVQSIISQSMDSKAINKNISLKEKFAQRNNGTEVLNESDSFLPQIVINKYK